MFYGRWVHRGLVAMLLLPLAASATAQIPPRSISTPKEEVDDALFGYIHGILYNDAELWIDGERLAREFPEFVPSTPTPFNDIELFTRTRSGAGEAGQVSIQFSVPLRYQVPVDILGYYPVGLLGSRIMTFEETIRPSGPMMSVDVPSVVTELLVLTLISGYMRVDFAPWPARDLVENADLVENTR